jgi:3-methyladenine DNA glycosylase/8-oxoguanine DNA glycosylase
VPERRVRLDRPLALEASVRPLYRGAGDPTMRLSRGTLVRAAWMGSGASVLAVRTASGGSELEAEAWGPGAEEALERLPALVGLDDDATGFDPGLHPAVAALAGRHGGLRLGRTGSVFEALLPAILEQKVTGAEAFRSFRRLVRALETPAPGSFDLWMPARAADVAAFRSWTFPGLGIEPRRGALLQRVARDASRLEAIVAPAARPGAGREEISVAAAALDTRLRAYTGIGPWTSAEVTFRALGDPDAVSVGDAHLPHLVAWVLAGEPRATDTRMLELLEPWRGHRARVVRLLELSGRAAPRYGPRVAPRDLVDLAPRR